MTKEEAKKVTSIIMDAEGGYSVSNLLTAFSVQFPEYKDDIDEVFREAYGMGVEEYQQEK